ncbi:MAG: transglutaminase domain protein [Candidatus Eremiobacteraeota bacterium]|nr:transglutaminase domain protein [Candidatus Eremiobacteraeota bacterium]
MKVDVGCEFEYGTEATTPAVVLVRPFSTDAQRVLEERWTSDPAVPFHDYVDIYGNLCRRLNLPPGRLRFRYAATVEVSGELDAFEPDARQLPVDALPDDALVYTLPSRYCLSDLLGDRAWELFGATDPGWTRVQAICDFVHGHVQFGYGSSTPATTAVDVFENAAGVCRDFAHLGVAFCRAMNVPARYVFGYIPDIDVPVTSAMDFCAWFEAYLDGEWWAFDPRNNVRRRGRVVIGRGRDALDVAMVTTYGAVTLHEMIVRADRVEG